METSGKRRLRMGKKGQSTRSGKTLVENRSVRTRSCLDSEAIKTLQIAYEFHGYWEETLVCQGEKYCKIEIEGGGHLQTVGAPNLPQEGIYVNIPENAKFLNLQVGECHEKTIEVEYPIAPNPLPALEGEELLYRKDSTIYDSGSLFPAEVAVFSAVRRIGGVKVVHILVNPVRYYPVQRQLQVVETMILKITYELSEETDTIGEPRHHRFGGPAVDILGMPEMDGVTTKGGGRGGREDIRTLKNPANCAELLIVTKPDLRPAFDDFLEFKSRDFKVALADTGQIISEFGGQSGMDEQIREFLCYAAENWRISPRYILLGGNITDIPTHWEYFLGARISSDHFYADLKGDLSPDVVVSRFPASEPEEMKNMCDYFIRYAQTRKEWGKSVLLSSYNREDYNECTEEVAGIIASDFQVYKRYDGQATKEEIIETINQGVGFINYRGHGLPTGWQAGNGLTSDDLVQLKNVDKIPQVLSIACSNNALEKEHCFGCEWIRQGKAVSFLGAAVPSYTVVNHEFDKWLWEGIALKKLKRAGEIFNYGIQKLYMNNPENDLVKHTIYAYLLVGDATAECDFYRSE